VQEVRQTRDPITSFREKIINAELTTADELKAIEVRIRNEVDAATKQSRLDKEIPLHELATDVYCDDNKITEIRNILPNNPLRHARLGKAVNL